MASKKERKKKNNQNQNLQKTFLPGRKDVHISEEMWAMLAFVQSLLIQ